MSFNKFPWTNLHGFNLDWVIEKVQENITTVGELAQEIVGIPDKYETKENITNARKLSPSGNFTGTWNGEKHETMRGNIDNNRDQIRYIANQFSDGQTGFVIDGGFFEESGIKANYNGGYF